MHDLYIFLAGPGAWIAFIAFVSGILFRLVSLAVVARQKDQAVYAYMNIRYALRSILHWTVPFASTNMRLNPVMTIFSFVFHLSLLIAPLFLYAHIILIKEAFDISWPALPDLTADVLSFAVLACCLYFVGRRLFVPEIKFLTSLSDFLVLALVAAPFLTGIWAYHQWPGHLAAGVLHILTGELLLVAIPFTKLSHMFLFPFTRGYAGSEFGSVKHAKDW